MAIADGKIRCPACGDSKPLGAFLPAAARRGSGKCRPCLAAYQRAWAKRNPEKAKAASARWWAKKSPADRKAYSKERRDTAKSSGARLDYLFKNKYGIRSNDYTRMLLSQGGKCAICGEPPPTGKRLYVDHDHGNGTVRGLLCQHCNTGLGMFDDDAQRMRNAIDYVQRSKPCPSAAVG